MNKRVRQAALKIMMLQEEFSKKELNEAAHFLSNGQVETIMELLREKPVKSRENRKSNMPANNGISKVVQDLKRVDPERYQFLKKFELLLRRGTILPTNGDLKKLGFSTSKVFEPGKSRNETISRLMPVLCGMPIESLRSKLEYVIDDCQSSADDEDAYHDLAQFLINGSKKK